MREPRFRLLKIQAAEKHKLQRTLDSMGDDMQRKRQEILSLKEQLLGQSVSCS